MFPSKADPLLHGEESFESMNPLLLQWVVCGDAGGCGGVYSEQGMTNCSCSLPCQYNNLVWTDISLTNHGICPSRSHLQRNDPLLQVTNCERITLSGTPRIFWTSKANKKPVGVPRRLTYGTIRRMCLTNLRNVVPSGTILT